MSKIKQRLEARQPLWVNWYVDDYIGGGASSEVYRLTERRFGQISAVKVISWNIKKMTACSTSAALSSLKEFRKRAESEIRVMYELQSCPYIVHCKNHDFWDYYDEDMNLVGFDVLIQMDYWSCLQELLFENGKALKESDVLKFARNITSALVAAHSKGIIHRDIKPENIFLDNMGNYLLGDFGVSKQSDNDFLSTTTGTRPFMAPEIYSRRKYDRTVDIYSLGIVMYMLLNNNRLPFITEQMNFNEAQEAVYERLSGKPIEPPAHGSEALKKIVMKCCAFKAEDRFSSASELLEALNGVVIGENDEFLGAVSRKPKIDIAPVRNDTAEATELITPAPEVSKPVPEVSKPAPEVSKPVPEVSKPAPEVSKPVPEVSKPAPEVSKPAPEANKPVDIIGRMDTGDVFAEPDRALENIASNPVIEETVAIFGQEENTPVPVYEKAAEPKKDVGAYVFDYNSLASEEDETGKARKKSGRIAVLAAIIAVAVITAGGAAIALITGGNLSSPSVSADSVIIGNQAYDIKSKAVILEDVDFTDSDLSELSRLTNLESLEIRSCSFEALSGNVKADNFKRLKSVYISDCKNNTAAFIGSLPDIYYAEVLSLADVSFEDGEQFSVDFNKFRKLKSLYLTDTVNVVMENYAGNKTLEKIVINNMSATNEECLEFVNSFENLKSYRVNDLSRN
ncbi:MAG: protein kinase [Ruminiclostridium sp.]